MADLAAQTPEVREQLRALQKQLLGVALSSGRKRKP